MRSAREDQLISLTTQHSVLRAELVLEDQCLLFCHISHAASASHNGIGVLGGVVRRLTGEHRGPPDRLLVPRDHTDTQTPTNTRTHSHTLALTHTANCVFICLVTADLFECFFISPPPPIEWVNMLYSTLTYQTTYTIMCNRLLLSQRII